MKKYKLLFTSFLFTLLLQFIPFQRLLRVSNECGPTAVSCFETFTTYGFPFTIIEPNIWVSPAYSIPWNDIFLYLKAVIRFIPNWIFFTVVLFSIVLIKKLWNKRNLLPKKPLLGAVGMLSLFFGGIFFGQLLPNQFKYSYFFQFFRKVRDVLFAPLIHLSDIATNWYCWLAQKGMFDYSRCLLPEGDGFKIIDGAPQWFEVVTGIVCLLLLLIAYTVIIWTALQFKKSKTYDSSSTTDK